MCKKGTIKFLKLNKNTLYLLLIQWIFTSRNTSTHTYFKHTQQAFNCSFCCFNSATAAVQRDAVLDGCEMLIPMEKEHFKQFAPGPEAAFVCIVWKAMIVKRSATMNNEKLHVHIILITLQYLNLYLYVSLATTITDSVVGTETYTGASLCLKCLNCLKWV